MVIARIFALLVCGGLASPTIGDVAGNWEGESICTVPGSPCHDEHVVYRISEQKEAPGKYTIAADKIVNGEPVAMGDLHCSFDPVKANLRCTTPGTWEFQVAGDAMTGTLKLDDGTLYRKISLRRQNSKEAGSIPHIPR